MYRTHLVDENKVVPQAVFGEISEITFQHLDELMEELEGKGSLRIALRYGDSIEAANRHVEENRVADDLDRIPPRLRNGGEGDTIECTHTHSTTSLTGQHRCIARGANARRS